MKNKLSLIVVLLAVIAAIAYFSGAFNQAGDDVPADPMVESESGAVDEEPPAEVEEPAEEPMEEAGEEQTQKPPRTDERRGGDSGGDDFNGLGNGDAYSGNRPEDENEKEQTEGDTP